MQFICCFLDASKAFDLVDHNLLFNYLFDRGLPLAFIRFFWYKHQSMCVRWILNPSICVMVFSRVVYCLLYSFLFVDGLLCKLKDSGVGCHLGCEFVGSVCYADDLALLAPSPRIMVNICESFARDHDL